MILGRTNHPTRGSTLFPKTLVETFERALIFKLGDKERQQSNDEGEATLRTAGVNRRSKNTGSSIVLSLEDTHSAPGKSAGVGLDGRPPVEPGSIEGSADGMAGGGKGRARRGVSSLS